MGEKENKPFQLSFNGLLKVDFQVNVPSHPKAKGVAENRPLCPNERKSGPARAELYLKAIWSGGASSRIAYFPHGGTCHEVSGLLASAVAP